MKLNSKRTILVGFAFFLICAFWQVYDVTIAMTLTSKFGLSQTASGILAFRRARHGPDAFLQLPVFRLCPTEKLPVVGTKFERAVLYHIFCICQSKSECIFRGRYAYL